MREDHRPTHLHTAQGPVEIPYIALSLIRTLTVEERAIVQKTVSIAQADFHRPLSFDEPFEVHYTNGMDILGAYVYHTHTRPIILLDPALIKANAATNNLNFANEVAITLAHEIAHAYQDRIGVLDETEDVEAAAETFAKIWLDRGEVCVDILTPRPIEFFSKPPF